MVTLNLDPIYKGRNLTIDFTLKNRLTKRPFTLDSGDVIRIAFKTTPMHDDYLLSSIVSAGENEGEFYASFTDVQTNTLPVGIIYWDLSLLHDSDCYPIITTQTIEVYESIFKRSVI